MWICWIMDRCAEKIIILLNINIIMSNLTPFGYIDFTGNTINTISIEVNGLNSELASHIASTSVHGVSGDVVGTTDSQTLSNKTLLTPIISSISNNGVVTIPTHSGTLALLTDIPSTSSFVDLSSAQTISGIKTFSNPPVISTITNTGTLTLPTSTTTLIGNNTLNTLTNKLIDSSTNTITITNSPLSNTNVNQLIDQDIRTTSSPSFVSNNLTNQLNIQTNNTSGVLINQAANVAQNTNGLTIQSGGVTKTFFGHNQSLDICYWSAAPGLRILTASSERLRIPAAGIANDNTITSILGLQGTTLVFKNNVVDTSTAQTLTNKTLTTPILTSPTISTITNTGTLTLPTTTGTLALTSQIPTNATYVDLSTVQTITGIKTFTNQIPINTTIGSGLILNCTNNLIPNNELAFNKNNAYVGSIGYNLATDEAYLWSNNHLKIGSGTFERIRIPSAGISTDNTITNILGLQGTTLVTKNNIVDTSTSQTLSNKTISNLVATGTTSSYLSGNYVINRLTVTVVGATTSALATISVASGQVIEVDVKAYGLCTVSAGGDLNKVAIYSSKYGCKNIGGVLTTYTLASNTQRDGAFGGATLTITTSGTNFIINANGIAGDTIVWNGNIKITN